MEIGGIRSGLGRDRSGKVSETEPVEGSKARSRRLGYRYGANRFKSHYIISGDSSRSLLKLAVYMYLQRASDVHVETDETTDLRTDLSERVKFFFYAKEEESIHSH